MVDPKGKLALVTGGNGGGMASRRAKADARIVVANNGAGQIEVRDQEATYGRVVGGLAEPAEPRERRAVAEGRPRHRVEGLLAVREPGR